MKHFLNVVVISVFSLLMLMGVFTQNAIGSSITLNTDAVEDAIVFIYPAVQDGTAADKEHPLGTGFLVWLPKKDKPGGYLLLITARHIFEPSWAHCNTPDPQIIFIRIDKKSNGASTEDGPVAYVPLRLRVGPARLYSTSSNDQIDSAVLPIDLYDTHPQKDYGWAPLNFGWFASETDIKKLKIGDSVAAAGLIPGLEGHQKNYAFFKFGHISSIFEEPFSTSCGPGAPAKMERVWFIDANLLLGNSGAPILYFPQFGFGDLAPAHEILIGTQSSAIPVQQTGGMPAGLAAITPIQYVTEIIEKMGYVDTPDFSRGGQIQK